MLDISLMQYNYRFRYLVTIDNEESIVNFYKHEKCIFEEAFLKTKPSKLLSVFIGKNCVCPTTEVRSDCDISDFDGNTMLLGSDHKIYNKFCI